jgi:hypothetical protein
MSKCAVTIINSPPTGPLSMLTFISIVVVDALQVVAHEMLAVARNTMLLRCHGLSQLAPVAVSVSAFS